MTTTKSLPIKLGRTTLFLNVSLSAPSSSSSILTSFHRIMLSSNTPSPSDLLSSFNDTTHTHTFPASWNDVDPKSDMALYKLVMNDEAEKVFRPWNDGESGEDDVAAVAVREVGSDKIGLPLVKLTDEEEDEEEHGDVEVVE